MFDADKAALRRKHRAMATMVLKERKAREEFVEAAREALKGDMRELRRLVEAEAERARRERWPKRSSRPRTKITPRAIEELAA